MEDDEEESWSGLLVAFANSMGLIKGAGLRDAGSGVSNGLTVWMLGLLIVSIIVGYQESDSAQCGFDTGGLVDLLWNRDGGSLPGTSRWIVHRCGITSPGPVSAD